MPEPVLLQAREAPAFPRRSDVGNSNSSEIKTWWRRRSTSNLIVHTGRRSRLVVIDADTREGGMEHFGELCDCFPELAATFRVATGSGGIHAYLRSDACWRSGMDAVAVGVDLRGEGGYVIGPTSRHISGQHYRPYGNSILVMSERLREHLIEIGAAAEKTNAH
jgi:Bifunctional DNA primase/polymerase, N-terminal